MLDFIFTSFNFLLDSSDPEHFALRVLVLGSVGLCLIGLVIRLISKIKGFAFFGG